MVELHKQISSGGEVLGGRVGEARSSSRIGFCKPIVVEVNSCLFYCFSHCPPVYLYKQFCLVSCKNYFFACTESLLQYVILNLIVLLQIHLKIIVDQPGHGINQENRRSNHPHWQLPVVQNGCSILNINSLAHSWACIWTRTSVRHTCMKICIHQWWVFCMNTVCLSHAVLALSSFCFHLVPNKRTKPKNNQLLFQFWHYFEKGSLTHRLALYSIYLRLEPIAI